MDWMRRLKVSLGTARVLAYLLELANPPIIHRDIKSNNILLDERLNAKVADFGLSKLMGDSKKGHVTTQVKGTMGYMDPEYYMTQQLIEKSDVYSFGVLMLELVTGRRPIERGKYIVREAMRCVEEAGVDRPTMGEVVKRIENIVQLAGLNLNAESTSTSASYGGESKGNFQHPYANGASDSSGVFSSSMTKPCKNVTYPLYIYQLLGRRVFVMFGCELIYSSRSVLSLIDCKEGKNCMQLSHANFCHAKFCIVLYSR
ncbi:hypothetical protein L1049_015487 [Liquidambar formosana]|uniref:Protein kinase domain-containing protein n=1 Tax=Liquidambar formosana TaxID=63359 RepID=A0AAP0X1X1_LIQFO